MLTSTKTPLLPSGATSARTSPSVATAPARLALLARPFFRMTSTAFSMSPAASTSALLQSLMPAWVLSRSSLTSCAVTSAMSVSSVGGPLSAGAGAGVDGGVVALLLLATSLVVLTTLQPFDARVGDARRNEPNGPDGVVVARNDEVDLIRIAVGVGDGDERHIELARLAHRDLLLVRVDHEHRVRERAHALQAAQVLLQPLALLLEARHFLLGKLLVGAVVLHALERAQAVEPLLDGAEVGEGAAQPAVGHEVHLRALRLFDDDVLRLALGPHEEDVAAATDRLHDEIVGPLEHAGGLVEVDDVDAVAGAVDEAPHLGVPALGLVPEVHARF